VNPPTGPTPTAIPELHDLGEMPPEVPAEVPARFDDVEAR
jgi:hypothetical protein